MMLKCCEALLPLSPGTVAQYNRMDRLSGNEACLELKYRFPNTKSKTQRKSKKSARITETVRATNGSVLNIDGPVSFRTRGPKKKGKPAFSKGKRAEKVQGRRALARPSPATHHSGFRTNPAFHGRPPLYGGLRNGVNDFAAAGASPTTISGYDAAKVYLGALADPLSASVGCHLLDPQTTVPCEATKYMASTNLAISNGTSAADGSLAILMRGDGYHTIVIPNSISAAHAITWTGGTYLDTYGSYTSSWGSRCVLIFGYITVFQTGDPHVVTAHSFRAPPAVVATQFGAGPTQTNYGVTSSQRADRKSVV